MSDLEELVDLPSWDWPADAADRIKRALGGPDTEELATAVELAGDLAVMDDDIAGLLLGVVRGSGPAELRGRAAIALGPALEEACEVGFDEELDSEFDNRVLTESRVNEIQSVLRALHDDEGAPVMVRRKYLLKD